MIYPSCGTVQHLSRYVIPIIVQFHHTSEHACLTMLHGVLDWLMGGGCGLGWMFTALDTAQELGPASNHYFLYLHTDVFML